MVSVRFGIGRMFRPIFSFGFGIGPKPKRWFRSYTLSFYQIEPWKHKSRFKQTASLKILPPFLWSCDKSNDILKGKPANKNGFSNRKGVMLVVVITTSSIFNVNIFILKNENTWDLKGFLTNKLLKGKKVNSNFCPSLQWWPFVWKVLPSLALSSQVLPNLKPYHSAH